MEGTKVWLEIEIKIWFCLKINDGINVSFSSELWISVPDSFGFRKDFTGQVAQVIDCIA